MLLYLLLILSFLENVKFEYFSDHAEYYNVEILFVVQGALNYIFMSDTEEPFQVVKRKRYNRIKHKGHTWLNSAYQQPCDLDNDIINSQSVLDKLHNCR